MSTFLKRASSAFAAVMAIGALLSPYPSALAQGSRPSKAPASVLPTGGGQALLDLLKIPVITSASEPGGPNGPLMPEIHEFAPHAVYVPRKGEVNAWDNEAFVKTVRATGRKTLIIAGVWTSVCVMFPALDAKAAGFKVYAVIDASGDPSDLASRTTLARFVQAGVIPTSTNAVLSETHRTWNRPEAAELAKLYSLVAPNYAAVVESYQKARDGIQQQRK